MDQNALVIAAVPTLAVIVGIVRNEFALGALGQRITNLEARLDARIETLDRDIRTWQSTLMAHNSDIAALKVRTGLLPRQSDEG